MPASARSVLPAQLAERTRMLREAGNPAGAYVMYWMRMAVRGHDNPALEAAIGAANAWGLPVFVYHAVSSRYPWASDRHHTFLLQGARDVAHELAARGVAYAFHLERPGEDAPVLVQLAAGARLVVTEDVPVDFLDAWTARVVAQSNAAVWAVDASCIVPPVLLGRAYDRAFQYRKATERLRAERLGAKWEATTPQRSALPTSLGFVPLPIATASDDTIAGWVAECRIDHTVGPVAHTRGGSVAGYARWDAFREGPLHAYHRRRNDALADATSRISAWLHYGHISPFRVAAQASQLRSEGAQKFLDELITWRELAYTWCRYTPTHGTSEALPDWARNALVEESKRTRQALWNWEDAARAQTGDALWDAAQRHLLIHGELHNNVRMTWGKAFVTYHNDVDTMVERCVDLNNRYALDGRDPNSYGGILWCFGALDRPFEASAYFGAVRPRSTADHARRLDVTAYAAHTGRPAVPKAPRVLVVGGGAAGALAARTLADHAWHVQVLDKGRGPGGRMATRRTPTGQFDHGAQHFVLHDRRLRWRASAWCEAGVLAPWNGTLATWRDGTLTPMAPDPQRLVGVRANNRLVQHLLRDVPVQFEVAVDLLQYDEADKTWTAYDCDGAPLATADAVVLAIPPAQAAALLRQVATPLHADLGRVTPRATLAAMVTFAARVTTELDGLFVRDDDLAWAAREASRPGRADSYGWVLHASPQYSQTHVDDDPNAHIAPLLARLATILGPLPPVVQQQAHRWRYATHVWHDDQAPPLEHLGDPDRRLVLAGDWCVANRVEGALLSGAAAAGRLLGLPALAQLGPPSAGVARQPVQPTLWDG